MNRSAWKKIEEMNMEGEPDLLLELIDVYLTELPRRLNQMKIALIEKNSKNFSREAHTLKSASALLGAEVVSKLCGHLEVLGNSSAFEQALPLLESLYQECATVEKIIIQEKQERENQIKNS